VQFQKELVSQPYPERSKMSCTILISTENQDEDFGHTNRNATEVR